MDVSPLDTARSVVKAKRGGGGRGRWRWAKGGGQMGEVCRYSFAWTSPSCIWGLSTVLLYAERPSVSSLHPLPLSCVCSPGLSVPGSPPSQHSRPVLWLVWMIPSSALSSPSGLGQCLHILENWAPSAFSGMGRHSINNDGRKERRNNKWKKDWRNRQEEEKVGRQEGGLKEELDMQIFLVIWSFLRLGAFSYSILYLQPLPQNNNNNNSTNYQKKPTKLLYKHYC